METPTPIKHFYKKTGNTKTTQRYNSKGHKSGSNNYIEYRHEITGRLIYRVAEHDKKILKLEDIRHGYSNKRIYHIWQGMMSRCYTKTDTTYRYYGAKGIRVDERWHDPEVFIFDMLKSYKSNLTLERIDYKGKYSKSNCKWIPLSEQNRNKRNNVRITIKGVTKVLVEWFELNGIKPNTAVTRILKYGWTPIKAVTTPTKFTTQWHTI